MIQNNLSETFPLQKNIQTLVELLSVRAENRRGKQACIFLEKGEQPTHELTFDQLDLRARAIAARLQDQGLSGERAILLYPSGLDYIAAFFGCLYAGVTAVPVYPPQMGKQVDRVLAIVNDSAAKAFLTNTEVLEAVRLFMPDLVNGKNESWIATDKIEDSFAESWKTPAINRDTLAFLQYTSGSTGNPKGVCVTHHNLLHNEAMIQSAFRHREGEMIGVGWLPLYHDMGLIGNIIQPIYVGQPIYLMSPLSFLQKPVRWLQAIDRFRGTSSGGPNFSYELLMAKTTPEEIAALDLSSWTVAFTGAEPVRADTIKRFARMFAPAGFREESFYPCYGMAESTLLVTGGDEGHIPAILHLDPVELGAHRVKPIDENTANALSVVGCGHTWGNQKVSIVNPDTCDLCDENQVGEVWVAGESVAEGYWNNPEASEKTFRAFITNTGEGPFLRTGDLGFVYKNELYITGRLKDLMIIRGRNHYPQDIEHTTGQSHIALKPGGNAAFSVEIAGEERLVVAAEIEPQTLKTHSSEEIFAAIRREIALRHELQVYAIALLKRRSIPKTSSGKIRRNACREAYLQRELNLEAEWISDLQEENSEEVAPETTPTAAFTAARIQDWIVAWMSKKLGINTAKIDPQESMQAYGLDSMGTAEFEEDISRFIGFKWPVMDFLINEPTIAEISKRGEMLAAEKPPHS
ncbi:MAG: AMP-binding protein [Bacteroidia bacterium]|nr:AMP-binding protein [Bacteroidia bacterium]